MRTIRVIVLALFSTLVLYSNAYAQAGTNPAYTPVQILPDGGILTTKFATNATSNTTLTITPASGMFLYVTMITIQNCAGAAVTGAAPLTITSTNLGGGITPAWTVGTAGTAGMCNPLDGYWGGAPMRSNTPGSAVTFVLPTFTTNQVIRINVFYFEWGK